MDRLQPEHSRSNGRGCRHASGARTPSSRAAVRRQAGLNWPAMPAVTQLSAPRRSREDRAALGDIPSRRVDRAAPSSTAMSPPATRSVVEVDRIAAGLELESSISAGTACTTTLPRPAPGAESTVVTIHSVRDRRNWRRQGRDGLQIGSAQLSRALGPLRARAGCSKASCRDASVLQRPVRSCTRRVTLIGVACPAPARSALLRMRDAGHRRAVGIQTERDGRREQLAQLASCREATPAGRDLQPEIARGR